MWAESSLSWLNGLFFITLSFSSNSRRIMTHRIFLANTFNTASPLRTKDLLTPPEDATYILHSSPQHPEIPHKYLSRYGPPRSDSVVRFISMLTSFDSPSLLSHSRMAYHGHGYMRPGLSFVPTYPASSKPQGIVLISLDNLLSGILKVFIAQIVVQRIDILEREVRYHEMASKLTH